MRRTDAPVAGWYPDPKSRTRLRWWDGLDWTDARRAPPSSAELISFEEHEAFEAAHEYTPPTAPTSPARYSRADSQQMIEDVRSATRGEVDRAADLLERRARAVSRDLAPLISQYSNRAIRWIRFAAIAATVLLVAYFVFQVVAQASMLEWIGDRIDNFTDDQNGFGLSLSP
ncbi:MAG: DUF2510 domain-containing protein [Actinobacteria bacterium]|jgi:hypothetical protein|nr:DUF2510 domain-containing protein [Actinomycetota bacterium]